MDARLILAAAEAACEPVAPVWRGAAILSALEERPLQDVALMPVAARDAALADWRARLFGPEVEAVATCPQCSETLEFNLAPSAANQDEARIGPTTADLAAALASDDPRKAIASFAGAETSAPDEVAIECPECGHNFALILDPATLLAGELGEAASRLLGEVVVLARSYGWSEAEILRLPPLRRAAYLEAALG